MFRWFEAFVSLALVVIALGGAYLFDQTRETAKDTEALAAANDVRITEARMAQLEACQRGNRQLRFVINRNIARPLNDVVKVAATPSGDPAFDVFVPFYEAALAQIKPIPYAICRNTYPPNGSEPHPPFFRDARLPAPLKP